MATKRTTKVSNRIIISFAAVIFVSMFDGLVIPVMRLSVGDIGVIGMLLVLGGTLTTLKKCLRKVLIFWCLMFLISIVNSVGFSAFNEMSASVITSISGLLRPVLFSFLGCMLIASFDKYKMSSRDVAISFLIAGCLLSIIVLFQYLGISPPVYLNNPAFGETGRWVYFSEGWRPTGLTNEASFVGIFLTLILTFCVFITKSISGLRLNLILIIINMGALLSTSRLGLVTSLLVTFIFLKPVQRIMIFLPALILFYLYTDTSRLFNLLSFDGDKSTFERYSSSYYYCVAFLDNIFSFSPGYLNGNILVGQYLDVDLLTLLDGRKLPSFSFPLQILLELGGWGVGLLLLFTISVVRKWVFSLFFLILLMLSMTTGIQNFLFVYIYIAGSIYAKYSHSS